MSQIRKAVQNALVFRQGQVDVAGIQASNPFRLAVTGGTGRFQNARGQPPSGCCPARATRPRSR